MATLITLANFTGPSPSGNGIYDSAGLLADSNGDLFGTTDGGGTFGDFPGYGTVYEITNTDGSFASTPTTLVNFNSTDGASPQAGLIADAAGDLFGTSLIPSFSLRHKRRFFAVWNGLKRLQVGSLRSSLPASR